MSIEGSVQLLDMVTFKKNTACPTSKYNLHFSTPLPLLSFFSNSSIIKAAVVVIIIREAMS